MKIQVASDLHIEFDNPLIIGGPPCPIEKTDADVIVLAGDIGVGFEQESVFCEDLAQSHQKDVVFVLGNHSFYQKGNVDKIRDQWANADIPGVHYLDEGHGWIYDENPEEGEIMFTGGILWTDFNNYNGGDMYHSEKGMSDFRQCRMYGQDAAGHPYYPQKASKAAKAKDDYIREYMFTPRRSVAEHFKIKAWIEASIDNAWAKVNKKVVVSHHLPSYKSIDDMFKGRNDSLLNPAYASDMDAWITDRDKDSKLGINLWLHGHTHSSCDYKLDNGTRVVCNPRGYYNYAENKEFNKSMVIEI